jgi:AP-1-like transcription factor
MDGKQANIQYSQRAFRERKEKYTKDLESQVHVITAQKTEIQANFDRAQQELQRIRTQNEILLAQAQQRSNTTYRPPSPVHGPQTYSPTDFSTAVGEGGHPLSYEDFGGPEGHRLLAVGATWDYIVNHESFQKGIVDLEDVQRRLKGRACCDGRGPAFREADIKRAIEESVVYGNDELI